MYSCIGIATMHKELINKIKPEINKAIEHLKSELGGLQVGRATPALVENIEVDCYGGRTPVRQIASINAPEPRMLVIQPWDPAITKDIERAISSARSGLSVAVDGEIVRINIPPLNEERRRELISVLSEKLEQARIAVRLRREKVWKEIQDLAREGKIREDDKFRAKDELQDLVDEYNEKIEEMGESKKKEVMTV
ncbi:MAG: Ribosome-recycling factor [Parcubacteria group bacterium GW2011_GWF2_39_13b]|nr:MAG: Ribosome-recycling factor [Parcubacteria group bacterium GW2011_GWF2_39_13b]